MPKTESMRFEGEYFYLCLFSFCLFCVFVIVCHVSHPKFIVKFTYHIGDNVKFKCGGEIGFVLAKIFQIFRFLSSFSS